MPTTQRKPKKPHADCPLTAHRNGQWCKKVRGKLWYFGTWKVPQAALEEYLRQKGDLQAGRQPGLRRDDRLDLAELCNAFLKRSEERVRAGDITPRTFGDDRDVCAMMLQHFGRTADPEKLHPELVEEQEVRAVANAVRTFSIGAVDAEGRSLPTSPPYRLEVAVAPIMPGPLRSALRTSV
jgi:hypothetical protein